MNPLQVLMVGVILIVVFIMITVPLIHIGGRLYKVLDRYAKGGGTLAVIMAGYTCLVLLINIVIFGVLFQSCSSIPLVP